MDWFENEFINYLTMWSAQIANMTSTWTWQDDYNSFITDIIPLSNEEQNKSKKELISWIPSINQ